MRQQQIFSPQHFSPQHFPPSGDSAIKWEVAFATVFDLYIELSVEHRTILKPQNRALKSAKIHKTDFGQKSLKLNRISSNLDT